MVLASTERLHSGHRFVLDGRVLTGSRSRALPGQPVTVSSARYGAPAMFYCLAREQPFLQAPG